MSEKREHLRVGVAMLESISRQLEQVSTELSGYKSEHQAAQLTLITEKVRELATNIVQLYDRTAR